MGLHSESCLCLYSMAWLGTSKIDPHFVEQFVVYQKHVFLTFCQLWLNICVQTGWSTYINKSAAGIAWCPATVLTSREVTVLNLCTSSSHALYLYQVLWNYLEWYQSYRVDIISILKITKGNNSAKKYNFHTNHIQNYKVALTEKNAEGVTVHNQSPVILLFVPSFVKLSQTVSKL